MTEPNDPPSAEGESIPRSVQGKREQFEQQWQDLDEKVLLVQILTELQQIRQALTQADRDPEVSYRCRKCDEVVSAAARERHATKQHKMPPDMDLDDIYMQNA